MPWFSWLQIPVSTIIADRNILNYWAIIYRYEDKDVVIIGKPKWFARLAKKPVFLWKIRRTIPYRILYRLGLWNVAEGDYYWNGHLKCPWR